MKNKKQKHYREPVNFSHMSIYVTKEQREKLTRHTDILSALQPNQPRVPVVKYIRMLIDNAPEPVQPAQSVPMTEDEMFNIQPQDRPTGAFASPVNAQDVVVKRTRKPRKTALNQPESPKA